jgi:hypothetical protein
MIIKFNDISIAYNPTHGKITRYYYLYCVELIKQAIYNAEVCCNVVFGNYSFQFDNNYPIVKIDIQIEHTLVKPEGRISENAVSGIVPISAKEKACYLVRIANFEYLDDLDIVIDYSNVNVVNIKKCGCYQSFSEKLFHLSPLVYDFNIDLFCKNRDLEVITLFGNPDDPRRSHFLNTLEYKGIDCKNINNHYEDVDLLYLRTKILINIRQTDFHDTLEEMRVLPALLCGVIVISESAPLVKYTYYSRFILWAKIEDLPDLAADVIKNYKQYHAKIFGGGRFFRRVNRLKKKNEIIASKIVNRIKTAAMS